MSADDLGQNKEDNKPKNNNKFFPQNKLVFVIIGIGVIVAVSGVFGYMYFEDQRKQLQTKLDAEQKKAQQLESQKKQEELHAQQVQNQLQQQAEQKQKELDQKQQQLQEQKQLQKAQQDIAQFKQQQLEQQATQQAAEAAQKQEELQQQALQQQAVIQQQQQQATQQQLQAEKDQIIAESKTNVLIRGVIKGYLNFYIPPVPNYADPGVSNGVENIATTLNTYKFYGVAIHRVYDSSQADISVQWIQNFGPNPLGLTTFSQFVQVGLGTNSCYGTWEPFTPWTVEKILWHEFGHTMGFGHSSDPNNVMYATTQTKFTTDYQGSIFLGNGYWKAISFCKAGQYYYSVSNDNQYNGFNVYPVPPNTNPNDVINGKASYYDCGAFNKISVTNTCSVAAGSYLLIYNPNKLLGGNDMNVNIKIVDNSPEFNPNMTWDMNVFSLDPNYLSQVWQLFHNN